MFFSVVKRKFLENLHIVFCRSIKNDVFFLTFMCFDLFFGRSDFVYSEKSITTLHERIQYRPPLWRFYQCTHDANEKKASEKSGIERGVMSPQVGHSSDVSLLLLLPLPLLLLLLLGHLQLLLIVSRASTQATRSRTARSSICAEHSGKDIDTDKEDLVS